MSAPSSFKRLVRGLLLSKYGNNLDVLDELAAPNAFNHTAVPEHQRGIEGFKHVIRWARTIFPAAHYEIEDMIAEGDKVACRITFSETHQGEFWNISPTGKHFSVEHVH